MTLPAQRIRGSSLVRPCFERTVEHGMTYGIGPAGYDLRIAQDVLLWPKCCALASTIERVSLPRDVKGRLSDKSTWARRFVGMMNTRVDPGMKIIGRVSATEVLTGIKGGGALEKYLGVKALEPFINKDLVLERLVPFRLLDGETPPGVVGPSAVRAVR